MLAVHDDVSAWTARTFPDADEYWGRLRVACGVDDLDDALSIITDRLNRVVACEAKEGDAERTQADLDETVRRSR